MLPKVVYNKEFLKLWLAQTTSQIGLNALYYVFTVKIYALTHGSNTAVGLLILAFTIPNIFFGYLAGVIVDRHSLKKVLLVTNSLRAIIILLLLLVTNIFPLVLVFIFLLAFVTLFFIPAEGSAIPSLVHEEDLIEANGLFSITLQTALVVGFLFGGFTLQSFGEATTLLIIFLLFVISLGLNFLLPQLIVARSLENKESVVKNFFEGIIFVFKTKVVRDSIFFLTLSTTFIFILATIGPGYIDKVLRLDVKNTSAFIIAPASVGMVIGSLLVSKLGKKFNQRFLINLGLTSLGVTFLLLSLFGSEGINFKIHYFVVSLIFLLGVENAIITVPVTTAFQTNTPEELRGRAYGLLGMFISGVSALPILISGAIADIFNDVRIVLIVMGLIILLVAAYRFRPKKYIIQN